MITRAAFQILSKKIDIQLNSIQLWSSLNGENVVPALLQTTRQFSISQFNWKDAKEAQEAKLAKEAKNPKLTEKRKMIRDHDRGKKKTYGFASVWRNMTVADMAKSTNRSLDQIQEVMLYVDGAEDLDPKACLHDPKIIKDIVSRCGLKTQYIPPPKVAADTIDTSDKDVFPRPPALPENLKHRPPVVVVMGHVDHGKTTLLDTLRGASVAAGEAGGITQHIGAFTVELENGESVTFLDTPGHAAFTSMRARGASCTDIIVLVVAAEDGVMQQTREVIKLAQDGKIPIIVAINKIDAPGANVEATKRGLLEMGLALEDNGGDVQVVCISALHGTNIHQLAEAITTQAVLIGLKSDYTGLVEGVVVESKTDARRGKLSTAIVTRGILRKGAYLVGGVAWAKVRGLFDHNNNPIDSASPGTPVEILGWRELPAAGDSILEVPTEKKANSVMKYRESKALETKAKQDLEAIKKKEEEHLIKYNVLREKKRELGRYRLRVPFRGKESEADDGTPKVTVILKGDVHGSVEAILDVLDTYDNTDKCRMSVVHYGVGEITDGDIELAKIFNSIIYAFNIRTPTKKPTGISIREFNVIYRLFEDVKEEINKKLPEVEVEEVIGSANVLQTFEINDGKKKIPVMGCRCVKGYLKKSLRFKLLRNDETIYNGKLDSMRHLKTEVESIKRDVECGLMFDDKTISAETGDVVVCYTTKMERQFIDWDPGF